MWGCNLVSTEMFLRKSGNQVVALSHLISVQRTLSAENLRTLGEMATVRALKALAPVRVFA